MEFYGQFPKLLRSLVDDVEESESLADDDDATKKRGPASANASNSVSWRFF